MLNEKMTFKEMLIFEPSDEQMASLDLDVVVYIKALFLSKNQESNSNMIKQLTNTSDSSYYFKNIETSPYFTFESKDNNSLTILELMAKVPYNEISEFTKDTLSNNSNETTFEIHFYTHDSHHYILHNLEGYINLEQIK